MATETSASVDTIHVAVRAALLASAGVTALLGSAGIVQGWLPDPIDDTQLPVIVMWDAITAEDTIDRGIVWQVRMNLTLDLLARGNGAKATLMQLEGAIRKALHEATLAPTGWKNARARFRGSVRMYESGINLERRSSDVLVTAQPA